MNVGVLHGTGVVQRCKVALVEREQESARTTKALQQNIIIAKQSKNQLETKLNHVCKNSNNN